MAVERVVGQTATGGVDRSDKSSRSPEKQEPRSPKNIHRTEHPRHARADSMPVVRVPVTAMTVAVAAVTRARWVVPVPACNAGVGAAYMLLERDALRDAGAELAFVGTVRLSHRANHACNALVHLALTAWVVRHLATDGRRTRSGAGAGPRLVALCDLRAVYPTRALALSTYVACYAIALGALGRRTRVSDEPHPWRRGVV